MEPLQGPHHERQSHSGPRPAIPRPLAEADQPLQPRRCCCIHLEGVVLPPAGTGAARAGATATASAGATAPTQVPPTLPAPGSPPLPPPSHHWSHCHITRSSPRGAGPALPCSQNGRYTGQRGASVVVCASL